MIRQSSGLNRTEKKSPLASRRQDLFWFQMALNYHTTRLFLQTNTARFLCSPTRIPNSALSSWKNESVLISRKQAVLVWCTRCWCIVWFLYWSRSVEKWAPVLTLRSRSWRSISSCISSTKGRKLQPWIDATTAPVEFSSVLLPSHVMKMISLGDQSQEIAGVGHQAPSRTGWSGLVNAFVLRLRWSPPYS
jgi:hypothetical protein